MIPKSGNRFSEKIMLKQEARLRSIGSKSRVITLRSIRPMNPRLLRYVLIARRGFKKAFDPIVGFVVVTLLKLIRRGDRARFANAAGRFMRLVGPWHPKHKVGRANLMAAFPEKSASEIEEIV